MTQDKEAFIEWLSEKYKIPESSLILFTKKCAEALPDGDYFEKLRDFILKNWTSPYTAPTFKWLNFHAARLKKQQGPHKEEIDPQIAKIRADKTFFEANYEACQKAKEEAMDVLEKIYGRRPGKESRQICF